MRASQLPQTKEEIRSMAIEAPAELWAFLAAKFCQKMMLFNGVRNTTFAWKYDDSKQQTCFFFLRNSDHENYIVYKTGRGDSNQQRMHSKRTEKNSYE